MFFSGCLAVPSVVASGGFSSPSIYLVQVLFRNEVECRASGSSTCAHLYVGVGGHPHPLNLHFQTVVTCADTANGEGKPNEANHEQGGTERAYKVCRP